MFQQQWGYQVQLLLLFVQLWLHCTQIKEILDLIWKEVVNNF